MPANRGKRGPYNKRAIDNRGAVGKEPRVFKAFWTDYNMDQVITMTPEELDLAIDKFIDNYAQRQLKHDKRWNFPLIQGHVDLRYNK